MCADPARHFDTRYCMHFRGRYCCMHCHLSHKRPSMERSAFRSARRQMKREASSPTSPLASGECSTAGYLRNSSRLSLTPPVFRATTDPSRRWPRGVHSAHLAASCDGVSALRGHDAMLVVERHSCDRYLQGGQSRGPEVRRTDSSEGRTV